MKITINEKEYEVNEITFGSLRKLEKLGFSLKLLENVEDNVFSAISSLVAYVIGGTVEQADVEIEQHIEKGGKLEDFAPLFELVSNSDFFRKLSEQQGK